MKIHYLETNRKFILLIFSISGMTALIYEIVWIRPLSLVFGTTIYAVSILVASFLLGLAVGSWLVSKYADRILNPLKFYALVELGIGGYGIFLISIFSILPEIYLAIYKITFPNMSEFFVFQFILAFVIILIPTTLMGTTLPLVMKAYSNRIERTGNDLGKLYSANNMGAVAGTLIAGFLLIPIVGIKYSIISTALINIVLSSIVLSLSKRSLLKYSVIIGIIVILFGVFSVYDSKLLNFGMYYYAFPALEMSDVNDFLKGENVTMDTESLYSSVTVTSFNGIDVIAINGKTQCSTNKESISRMQELAQIPYSLFETNYKKPDSALNIGLGCGTTSQWLGQRVNTTTIEIDPAIIKAATYFTGEIHHKLIIDDARNWLERNNNKFDIIVTQPPDPFSGQGYLFTREYFQILGSRLAENGIIAVWAPVHLMTLEDFYEFFNTFHSVFPNVYIFRTDSSARELLFVGSHDALHIPNNPLYLVSDKKVPSKTTLLNTDDKPLIEFSSAYNLYRPNTTEIFEKISSWKNS